MKIIFNKYGGLKTIEDRQLLVQSSSNANYVDIYYQDENGNFADETVNLATIAFKRADSFEIMEKTCDAVREELTNKLLYFRYVFQEDDLAVNGELQITVRLKQVVFDPEDQTQILLIKQRAMGKLVAHIYEAVGTDYEEYNVIDGRLLQLELWQSTFDGTYYDVTQIDAIIAQEVLNRNNAINDHNNNANAHASIREKIATNAENIRIHDERLGELELFAETLETNITEEIEGALDNKADLVDGRVPREQLPSYSYDEIIDKPVSVIFEITSFTELTPLQKTTITNQLMPLLNDNLTDLDTNKYSDLILKYLDERYHYSSVAVIDGEVVRILFDYKNEDTKIKLDINFVGDDSQTVIELVTINFEPEGTVSTHNTSETAHTNIRNAVAEAKAIAEGKSRARVFATKSALDTWLLDSENVALLQIGDHFYIEETDKPDYWWNGTTIKELETQKVDLTEYAKSNDLATVATTGSYNDLTNTPTIPTIPNISITNGSAESGKYISQVAVDETDKHKLIVTKADLPTIPTLSHDISTDIADTTKTVTPNAVGNYTYSRSAIDAMIGDIPTVRPTIELEVASLTTLTEAEKLAIKNTLSSLIVDDKIDGTKFDDIVLVTTNDLIRLHYSSIDYYVANPQITVIFETESTKYILNVTVIDYTYSTLTSTTTDIPNITVNNGSAESGKYISQVAVDATDKHKLIVTKADLPTLRPTIELEVASLTTLTEAEKLAIKNTLSSLIVDDKIDGTKFDDIVLVTTNDLIRLHYSSIDYYVANPQITVIFETESAKYILNVTVIDYTYSTLTSTTTDIPNITVNNGSAESGKYISQVAVDATDKHKLIVTKADLPTLRPTIELEVASLTTLTEAEKLAIKNTLSSLIVDDKIDGTKFDDIVLVTTNDLIRLHYSSIDYYVANPQITVIFETESAKYILNVTVIDYTYSTLTSTTTDIPNITVNNGSAESGKYISQVAVDATDKHKLIVTKADLPQGFSGDYEDLTNVPDEFTPSEHNHDGDYYKKTETYSKTEIDTMFDNLLGGSY